MSNLLPFGWGIVFGFICGCIYCLFLHRHEPQTQRHICDCCGFGRPVVFCHGHIQYVCEKCLPLHIEPGECRFSSMAALRERQHYPAPQSGPGDSLALAILRRARGE